MTLLPTPKAGITWLIMLAGTLYGAMRWHHWECTQIEQHVASHNLSQAQDHLSRVRWTAAAHLLPDTVRARTYGAMADLSLQNADPASAIHAFTHELYLATEQSLPGETGTESFVKGAIHHLTHSPLSADFESGIATFRASPPKVVVEDQSLLATSLADSAPQRPEPLPAPSEKQRAMMLTVLDDPDSWADKRVPAGRMLAPFRSQTGDQHHSRSQPSREYLESSFETAEENAERIRWELFDAIDEAGRGFEAKAVTAFRLAVVHSLRLTRHARSVEAAEIQVECLQRCLHTAEWMLRRSYQEWDNRERIFQSVQAIHESAIVWNDLIKRDYTHRRDLITAAPPMPDAAGSPEITRYFQDRIRATMSGYYLQVLEALDPQRPDSVELGVLDAAEEAELLNLLRKTLVPELYAQRGTAEHGYQSQLHLYNWLAVQIVAAQDLSATLLSSWRAESRLRQRAGEILEDYAS